MNKESERLFFQSIGNSIQENKDKIVKLEKQNLRLKNKNKKLQERIDKAIEYVTKEMRIVNDNEYHRLVEILKGEKE